MGYKTSNWVVNMGSSQFFLAFMVVQFLTTPLILACWKCDRCLCIKNKLQESRESMKWNGFIRFFIEIYFELCLICVIRIKTFETDTRYEEAFTYSACAVLACLVLFNYLIALWEGLNKNNRLGFFSVPIFLVCRLFFVYVLVFYQEWVTI
jgi:hypothetical protein